MNSRRQTMGGLTASQMNSRQSIGAGRVATAEGRKSMGASAGVEKSFFSGGRPSIGGRPSGGSVAGAPSSQRNSLQRRASMYGPSAPAVRQDPRALSDKAFQNSCMHKVIAYLASHGYDRALSPKLLTTNKEFAFVVQFLFSKVDPHIKFSGKVEDEVPVLFKRLRYPFNISKSALQAVGSPHTWPSLLAALAWLVELLTYDERAEASNEAGDFSGVNSQRMLFDYVAKAYELFLAGDDDAIAHLDAAVADSFRARDAGAAQEAERLERENAALDQRIAACRSGPDTVAELEARNEAAREDAARLRGIAGELQSHLQALQQRITEKRAETEQAETDIAASRAENELLRARISAQEISTADVERLVAQRVKLEEARAALAAQRAAAERAACECELALEQRVEEIGAGARAYEQAAEQLKIVPFGAKRSNNMRFELSVNTRGRRPEEILSLDFKGQLRPNLETIKEDYRGRLRDAEAQRVALRGDVEASEDGLRDLREQKAGLEGAVQRCELQYLEEQDRTKREVRRIEEEAEALEGRLAALRSAPLDAIAASEARLRELQEQHDAVQKQLSADLAGSREELLAVLDLLMGHKQAVQDALGRLRAATAPVGGDLGVPERGFAGFAAAAGR